MGTVKEKWGGVPISTPPVVLGACWNVGGLGFRWNVTPYIGGGGAGYVLPPHRGGGKGKWVNPPPQQQKPPQQGGGGGGGLQIVCDSI